MPGDFESRYAGSAPALSSFCRMLARNEAAAADLFQETWRKALESPEGYRGEGSYAGWLCAIARNLWVDQVRRRGKEARALSLLPARAEVPPASADLAEALMGMPERERLAVQLYHLQGLSLREAASALDASVWEVRESLGRAHARLLYALEEPGKSRTRPPSGSSSGRG